MDSESKKFVKGPGELTGAMDLINQYKLVPHHEFYCKRSLPLSILDTHYLHNVVGDREIRKGDGMQLDQLIQNSYFLKDTGALIQAFDISVLNEAFQMREEAPVNLSSSDKGMPTIAGKRKSEFKEKDKKYKENKKKNKEIDKEFKTHKNWQKDRSKEKDKGHSKKHHGKKRKIEGKEDVSDFHGHEQ